MNQLFEEKKRNIFYKRNNFWSGWKKNNCFLSFSVTMASLPSMPPLVRLPASREPLTPERSKKLHTLTREEKTLVEQAKNDRATARASGLSLDELPKREEYWAYMLANIRNSRHIQLLKEQAKEHDKQQHEAISLPPL
jgi:hypothetical protein